MRLSPPSLSNNIGVGAAFAFKAFLSAAVGMGFYEILWASLRHRSTKIGSIDKFMTMLSNPFNLLSLDAVKTAPLAVALAILIWIIPLAAIFTPSTLEVGLRLASSSDSCIVPVYAGVGAGSEPPNEVFYTRGSNNKLFGSRDIISRLATKIFPVGSMREFESPCGSNCSFTQSFVGPTLDCQDTGRKPFKESNTLYSANSSFGTDSDLWSIAITARERVVTNYSIPAPSWLCTAYEATYTIKITYINHVPTYDTSIVKYEKPFPAMTETELGSSGAGAEYTARKQPQVLLPHLNGSSRLNTYALIFEVVQYWLVGSIIISPDGYAPISTKIQDTTLLQGWYIRAGVDLGTAVPDLLKNLTLSTLALPLNVTGPAQCTLVSHP